MNIKILDSLLRKHLKTSASPKEIAEKLSLTSMSIEKVEKINDDFLYEMEITANRPDLFSVLGIAKEAAAILPQFGIKAGLIPLKLDKPGFKTDNKPPIIIEKKESIFDTIKPR